MKTKRERTAEETIDLFVRRTQRDDKGLTTRESAILGAVRANKERARRLQDMSDLKKQS